MNGIRFGVSLGIALALAPMSLTACSSDSDSDGKTIGVTLVDYKVTPDATNVAAGKVTFKVHNTGTFVHELVVNQSDTAMPTQPNGEVNEDLIAAAKHLGEVEDVAPGETKNLTLTLPAGKYVLFCNRLDGTTVHFKEGMHADFTVT